eukprot:scaffold30738_cov105-Isochrysis_galbana.AAC.6
MSHPLTPPHTQPARAGRAAGSTPTTSLPTSRTLIYGCIPATTSVIAAARRQPPAAAMMPC